MQSGPRPLSPTSSAANTLKLLAEKKKEAKQEATTETELTQHIAYFAERDTGNVSTTSVRDGLERLHDGPVQANLNAALIMAGGGYATHGCPFMHFKPSEGTKIMHARDTGLFNSDGSFNEQRWNKIFDFADTLENGAAIISKTQMYNFLEACKKIDNKSDTLRTGQLASNAEWENFFKKFTTHWTKTEAGANEPCVSLDVLKLFYVDAKAAYKMVEDKQLPAAEPAVAAPASPRRAMC